MDILKALILGIVEGLTEFIPVSSTGHLILAGQWLSFEGEFAKLFEVFIQLGAILAVVWIYRARLMDVTRRMRRDPVARRFALNLVVAFIPAAALGLLFHGYIKQYLFGPFTVAAALVAGGIAILIIERMHHRVAFTATDSVTPAGAFWVGVAQVFALFPGVSRSGATIMGGLLAGMSRTVATEFSFFLAIPTMFAATVFDLFKGFGILTANDVVLLAVGFVAAFFSGLVVVRWLIRFVSTHDFRLFAWYRIVFGIILLVIYR